MKRWLSLFVLLLFATAIYGRSTTTPTSEESHRGDSVSLSGDSLRLNRVVELTSDGVMQRDLFKDRVKARALFEEALRIDPDNIATNYQMAILLKDEDGAKGVAYAVKAMNGDTTNLWSMDLCAQSLLVIGQYNQAKRLYQKLIYKDPTNADYYRILAILHQYTDRPYSAIMVLDSAELKIGRHPYLSQIKQNLLLSTKQEQRALDEALEMVANTPYDIQSRISLADVYAAMQRDSLAEAEYGVALSIDATSREALTALCGFYESKDRVKDYFDTLKRLFKNDDYSLSEALRLISRVTSDKAFYSANYLEINELISIIALRFPNDKLAVDLRANHLISFGMLDEALEIYKSHTHDSIPRIEYFQSVIEIESYKKRADSVELYTTRAIELFPDDIDLYITRANSKAYAKDYAGSIVAYRDAMKYAKSDTIMSNLWGYIGDMEYQVSVESPKESHKKKAMKRCYAAYDKALALYADNVLVLNNYAYFISEEAEGDYEHALTMSTRAIAITESSTYLDTHAWLLYRLNRLDEAAKYMKRAISLDKTGSPELPLHYGDILAAQGNNFMAEVYWKRAQTLGYPEEEIRKRIDSLKKGDK